MANTQGIELSISMIVMLIFTILIFSLSLYLLLNWFGEAQELEQQISKFNKEYGKIFKRLCKNYDDKTIALEHILNTQAFKEYWRRAGEAAIKEDIERRDKKEEFLRGLNDELQDMEKDQKAFFNQVQSAKEVTLSLDHPGIYKDLFNPLVKAYCTSKNISPTECEKRYGQYRFRPEIDLSLPFTKEGPEIQNNNLMIFECEPNVEKLKQLTPEEVQEFNKALGYTDYEPEKPEPDIAPETQPNSLDISEE